MPDGVARLAVGTPARRRARLAARPSRREARMMSPMSSYRPRCAPTVAVFFALALVVGAGPAAAARLVVPFWGEVSGYNVAGLGTASFVLGEFTIETGVSAFGGGGASADYLYGRDAPGAYVRLWTPRGFALELPLALVHVAPRDNGFARDMVILQSYLSESPNDWHLELHLYRDDDSWLAGSIAQPTDFGIDFDEAWLNAWFTDEYDRVREIWIDVLRFDAPPAPVPLPALLAPFVAALGWLLARRRSG